MRSIASCSPSKRQASDARDDDEVRIRLGALATGIVDLGDELVARRHVRHVFVVVRALGIQLVLDVDAGDAGANELADRAHGVQRFAEAGAAIGNQRYRHGRRHVAGDAHLLIHGQQRLRGAARAAGHEAAGVDRRKSEARDQPAADRVVGRRHVDEAAVRQQSAQRGGCALHGRSSLRRVAHPNDQLAGVLAAEQHAECAGAWFSPSRICRRWLQLPSRWRAASQARASS